MHSKLNIFVLPCLLSAGFAQAASLNEQVLVQSDSVSGYQTQTLGKSGNHVLAVPNDYSTAVWAGDPQDTKLNLQMSMPNADGSVSNARARAESTVGYNRVEVAAVAGIPMPFSQAADRPSYMTAQARSSWDTMFVITGGTGTGTLSFEEYIHFDYAVGMAAQSTARLTFTAGVYTGIDTVESQHQLDSRYDSNIGYSGCLTVVDGSQSAVCNGEYLLGSSTGSIRFTYGQPIYVAASLAVEVQGTALISALQTAGIRNLVIPQGASFAYTFGEQDNPLGISVISAVPEPATTATLLLGLLAVAGVARRRA